MTTNKIVQLSDFEYSQLYEKAKLNDEKIHRLAEKYYEERGVFRIDVKMGFANKYNGDTDYYTTVFSTENGLYKNNEFKPILTKEGRQKINKIVKDLCDQTFWNKFGDTMEFKNMYADALSKLALLKWILYGIAFSGWGVAAGLLIKLIQN